jgi:multiple sugar transport system permease protein
MKSKNRSNAGHLNKKSNLLSIIMLCLAAYFITPLIWLLISSTKETTDLYTSFGLWFAEPFVFFNNLKLVFQLDDGIFLTWMRNSFIYSFCGAMGAAVVSTITGYGFAKYNFRGSKRLFSFILASIMVPSTALAIPTYLLFAKLQIVNTIWAIILPSLVSPLGVYLMKVYSDNAIPQTLIEAARIDGATEFRIFREVSFRLLAPGFVTVLLLSIVGVWNNYLLPLIMLSKTELQPLTVGLAIWNGRANGGGGGSDGSLQVVLITASLISIIPLIAAFLLLQKYWENGLSAGAVKE